MTSAAVSILPQHNAPSADVAIDAAPVRTATPIDGDRLEALRALALRSRLHASAGASVYAEIEAARAAARLFALIAVSSERQIVFRPSGAPASFDEQMLLAALQSISENNADAAYSRLAFRAPRASRWALLQDAARLASAAPQLVAHAVEPSI